MVSSELPEILAISIVFGNASGRIAQFDGNEAYSGKYYELCCTKRKAAGV